MSARRSWLAVGTIAAVVWMATATWNSAAERRATGAAGGDGTRVAVVDLVRVFNEFDQTKVLNQKMSALEDELRSEDQRRNQELDTQRNAVKAFAPDSAEFKKQNDAFRRLMVEYQVWKATEQDRVAQGHLRWVNRTYKMVEDEVAAVAKAKGFHLVITREDLDTTITDSKVMLKQIISRKVIYSEPGVELTDEVLTNLNAAFAKAGGAKSIDFNK